MSCCNKKTITSDILDLSDLQNPCMLNSTMQQFLSNRDTSVEDFRCCNGFDSIVRYEVLSDNHILFTIENKITNEVEFLRIPRIDPEESVETTFKRLVWQIEFTYDRQLEIRLRQFCINYTNFNDNLMTLMYAKDGLYLVTSKDNKLIKSFSIKTNIVAIDEYEQYPLPVNVVNQFVRSYDQINLSPTMIHIWHQLGFQCKSINRASYDLSSFKTEWFKQIDDYSVMVLNIEYLNTGSFGLANELNSYLKEC